MDESTLIAAFRKRWRSAAWRDHLALLSDDVDLTYGELADRVESLAGGLVARGLQPGEIVALSMARTGASVAMLLAVLFAGGSVCPLEARLSATEVATRLRRIRCRWAIADDDFRHQFAATDAMTAVIDRDGLAIDTSLRRDADRVTPDTPALTLFTSGSTGTPKAVQLTHRAIFNNAAGVVERTELTFADRMLHVMPIYHTNGINNQILAPFLAGSQVAFAPRFRAPDMPELMARYRPTMMAGVPTMYSRMLAHDFPPVVRGHLRMLRCGSAPITPDLQARIEAAFGCPVIVSYGLSEATCTSTMNPPHDRRIGSVGTALSSQTVALLDPEHDVRVADGAQGEIAIAGDNLMSGYLDDNGVPDSSATASGWLRSGDLGRFDEDGYLFITGRIKDVIIRGGENLPPGMIEDVITADAAVDSCCVVGRPDQDLGEVPVAFVVARRGAEVDVDRIREAVGEQLSKIHRPEAVMVVDRLPENAVGKVDRRALTQRVADEAEASA